MTVTEHFKTLCAIPHCSGNTEGMLTYLSAQSERYGYDTRRDAAGNLLCTRPGSSVTLQAHYDMVCIGKAPALELYEENGLLRARESTLGADNGMGMAMMLALMEEGAEVDCLFTSDEETGLVGARGLALPLKTPFMLNLDSEEYGEITIGCAGGVDLNVTLPLHRVTKELYYYESVAEGFPGGHSGVDIDKQIPNAVKELAARLNDYGGALVSFAGGERRNAIPKKAVAVVGFEQPLDDPAFKPLGKQTCSVIENGVVKMLHGFAHGVRAYNTAVGIVQASVNLALVETSDTSLQIKLSARAMRTADLRRIESETKAFFVAFGASVQSEGFYAPWEPEENDFVRTVKSAYESVAGDVTVGAIHAGLECGIIREAAPAMQMASVGPTINHPHSTRECVDLESVEKVFEVVRRVIADTAAL